MGETPNSDGTSQQYMTHSSAQSARLPWALMCRKSSPSADQDRRLKARRCARSTIRLHRAEVEVLAAAARRVQKRRRISRRRRRSQEAVRAIIAAIARGGAC